MTKYLVFGNQYVAPANSAIRLKLVMMWIMHKERSR